MRALNSLSVKHSCYSWKNAQHTGANKSATSMGKTVGIEASQELSCCMVASCPARHVASPVLGVGESEEMTAHVKDTLHSRKTATAHFML